MEKKNAIMNIVMLLAKLTYLCIRQKGHVFDDDEKER